jgi:hypothetical protein
MHISPYNYATLFLTTFYLLHFSLSIQLERERDVYQQITYSPMWRGRSGYNLPFRKIALLYYSSIAHNVISVKPITGSPL